KRLASGGEWENTVKLWDAATGQETLTLRGDTGRGTRMAFSPGGKRPGSGGGGFGKEQSGGGKGRGPATGKGSVSLRGHSNWVTSVAFSPDGKRLASASYDGTVQVWDVATGQETLHP